MAARALLHEQHRARRIQLDQQGNQRQQRGDEEQADRGSEDADQTRGDFGRAMVAESLRQDQRARPERLDGDLPGDPLVQLDGVVNVDAADA